MQITADELCDLFDSKLEITTINNETFEGVLKLVLLKNDRVTFEHVYELPSRKYLGTMHTKFSNVSCWKLIEKATDCFDISNFNQSQKSSNGILSDENQRMKKPDLKEHKESSFFACLPSHLKSRCSYDYVIIDSISSDFYRAVEHLSECSSLGVSFHGPEISRSGELTWICISSQDYSFLFDIQNLSEAAFVKGLNKIIESNEIEKIVHDCREPSDCLLHMFNTEIRNVFDTQAADYLISMQMYTGKDPFRNVNALDSCLFKYLGVPQEFLFNRNKSASINEEKEFFRKRPVNDEFIHVLLKSSIFLVPLKEKEEELLMFPFEQAVLLNLNSLRTAPDSEVQLKTSTENNTFAPDCLLESLKSVRFSELSFPAENIANLFKSTAHGQKAWKRWKMIQNSESDSE